MIDLRRCRTARPPRRLFGTAQVESLEARLVMSAAPTTVLVGLSSSPIREGQPLFLTAGVNGPTGKVNEGTVTFRDGSTVLGSAPLQNGFAQLNLAGLSQGTHAISVRFDGTADYLPSQSTIDPSHSIRTVAGNGTSGVSGDGDLATSAQLTYPNGLATDAAGNIFIADLTTNLVRKVSPAGIISTVAGNGTSGYSGDGGSATSAQLNYPRSLAVDAAGNLYIGDLLNNVVRRVTPEGMISTVVGTGVLGFSGDDGLATSAQLNGPSGLAFDTSGNLYIADTFNFRIRKVTPNGIISTVAGNGEFGYTGGGPATATPLYQPIALAVDAAGTVYFSFSVNQLVAKLSPNGVVSTVAGIERQGLAGDGGPATSAEISWPEGLAVDAAGNLFIANLAGVIRKVDLLGNISTVVGIPPWVSLPVSQDGTNPPPSAGSIELKGPTGLTFDAAGNLIIADPTDHRVYVVNANPVFTVTARPAGFRVTGLAAQVAAGVEQTISITAVDANGNPLLDFNGDVTIRKTGIPSPGEFVAFSQIIESPNIVPLVNGSGIAKVTFQSLGLQALTVTDSAEPIEAGIAAVVDVIPGQAKGFQIRFPSISRLSQFSPAQVSITALDLYGNVATGYNGTLIFASSDPQALLPNGLVVRNGIATTEITFQNGGTRFLSLTDSVDPTLRASGDLDVEYSLKGIVFRDDNANGIRDPGEVGLAGREVFLDFNSSGIQYPGVPTAISGADGSILFPLTGPLIDFFGVVISSKGTADSLQNAVLLSRPQLDGSLGMGLVPFSSLAPVTVYPNPQRFDEFGPPTKDPQIEYVRALYRTVLGRYATPDEVDPWVAALKAGTSRQTVSAAFVNSPEHRLQQVTSYYRTFLDRDLDPTASVWVERLRNGASETEVVAAILDSPEYQAKNQDNNAFVADLYSDLLGRRVDDVGLADKTALLANNESRATIIDRTLNSVEAVDQVLDGFYSVYLRRQRDATSKVWSDTLFSSAGSTSDVAASILASDEFFQNAQA